MEDILLKIIEKKKLDIEKDKKEIDTKSMYSKAVNLVEKEMQGNIEGYNNENIFKKEIFKDKLSIIGEFKKASPSKGIIVEDFKIDKILEFYEKLDVDCYSILTEKNFFYGSDENLKFVRNRTTKPILRKDFIIDFYQIYESVLLGADSILLIASVLNKDLIKFYKEAKEFNLEPLVEVHNKEELELALDCGCEIIGINNRNLNNFRTSLEVTERLIELIPKDRKIIAESGILNINDINHMKNLGASGVLIGEMFMRNINNEEFISEYKSKSFLTDGFGEVKR